SYDDIISLDNLLEAWREFIVGKRSRKDVQVFERRLMRNIISLHTTLLARTYTHSPYQAFNISDPKPRSIHKASVRDRLLHHALYRTLYPFFDRTFIPDSYSCRKGKGTHKAMDRFRRFAYAASKNHTKTVWVLKCDIRKFFANINHRVLVAILEKNIADKKVIRLLSEVIGSFDSTAPGIGLPLGNLTSQLLVNVYMNEFDQFVKHTLKAKHYIRYADDFIFLSRDKEWLEQRVLPCVLEFLSERLRLELHPNKVFIKTVASGVDFLGWTHFPDHRVLRTTTKRRMMKRLQTPSSPQTLSSYSGMLQHGNTFKLQRQVLQ
ncbi:MAG TPA: reverse transcriptase domain-containing protein, partial [Candidatus Paceibacterota bacterium]|nr:reverse transcriptase domain-containing protein [Candidatus Paceibacterota bacterium]